jgi:hypothetical protein
MHIEDLHLTLALIETLNRTDDIVVKEKLTKIINTRLDAIIAEGN